MASVDPDGRIRQSVMPMKELPSDFTSSRGGLASEAAFCSAGGRCWTKASFHRLRVRMPSVCATKASGSAMVAVNEAPRRDIRLHVLQGNQLHDDRPCSAHDGFGRAGAGLNLPGIL